MSALPSVRGKRFGQNIIVYRRDAERWSVAPQGDLRKPQAQEKRGKPLVGVGVRVTRAACGKVGKGAHRQKVGGSEEGEERERETGRGREGESGRERGDATSRRR